MSIQAASLTPPPPNFQDIVGVSAWARDVRKTIARVGPREATVLITGPSGVGKELIARAIHDHSPRFARPFVPVDCAALAGELFTSQMFGHVKGAFTGAADGAVGLFRAAHGGTIFLDEIGELRPHFQAKLLRVLQHRTVMPVGSHSLVPVDVRVVAATNRDLAEEVAAREFREDLYYRLNVVAVNAVPLRERPEDIEPLARHFLDTYARRHEEPARRLSEDALRVMQSYPWPGNVRELENILERALVFVDGDMIEAAALDLPPAVGQVSNLSMIAGLPCAAGADNAGPIAGAVHIWRGTAENDVPGRRGLLGRLEREQIVQALTRANNNQSVAASLLGISRHQLRTRMENHGLMGLSRRGRPPGDSAALKRAG